MTKLCTMAGATIGGYAGWYLAARWGWGWAFVVSGVGSLAGVYFGWKLARRFE